jgi:regulator of RNase E activity RraA
MFSTSLLNDVMRSIGMDNFTLSSRFKPLIGDTFIQGKVFTILGKETKELSDHETLVQWTKFIDSIPSNYIAVCQSNSDKYAIMGDLSAETLKRNGVLGYIVDGGCRDISAIKKLNFPVFYFFNTPEDVVGRWVPEKLKEPIMISGVEISTDDFIVADSDGIIVIPSIKIQEVKEKYNKIVNDENLVRTGIKKGLSSFESYIKYKKF